MSSAWQFWIDVGGTFTDCLARDPAGRIHERKVLSSGTLKCRVERVDPSGELDVVGLESHPDDFFRGYRASRGATRTRVGEVTAFRGGRHLRIGGAEIGIDAGDALELSAGEPAPVLAIRAVLGLRIDEGIGEVDVRLGTTRGTNALLERQGARTCLVTTDGFGDLLAIGDQSRPRLFELDIRKPELLYTAVIEVGERTAADGSVLVSPQAAEVLPRLESAREAGAESVAICFLNAYRNDANEAIVAELAQRAGFEQISVSSRVSPTIKMVSRGDTTVVDAYLTPVLERYLESVREAVPEGRIAVMSSAGGLMELGQVSGKDTILSGPAGGVVALAQVAGRAGFERAIGFDMGGTSTDVSRYSGSFAYEHETRKAGVRIVAPMLAIETVAAGGGSICGFDGQKLVAGPRSAGADPGPMSYGRGGPLTVTDANFVLGRLPQGSLPFPLEAAPVRDALSRLAVEVAEATSAQLSAEELAQGFVRIANTSMAAAIRRISVARGVDPRDFALVCFGGAGGQHACAVARELGMATILIHPYAGVLSAFGMGCADVRKFSVHTVMAALDADTLAEVESHAARLGEKLRGELLAQGIAEGGIRAPDLQLDLRYVGQATELQIAAPEGGDWRGAFEAEHHKLYGHVYAGRQVEVAALRVEVVGELEKVEVPLLPDHTGPVEPEGSNDVYFEDRWVSTPIVRRESLGAGATITGPVVIAERSGTTVVDPGWDCRVSAAGDLVLTDTAGASSTEVPARVDPIQLEIFNHHFAAIAEEMGATLRRTALSVNVKERLDFSCAVFTGEGSLVANAPHMPVHLGAMSETVRCVAQDHPDLGPGDVVVTNDPFRGGSHLPDVTVVTPVFGDDRDRPLFFTASRAHHAEIGGSRPGSMPPDSRCLADEGVLIRSFRVVAAGQPRFEELGRLLGSGRYPSRSPEQNLADVGAQVAANQLGVQRLHALMAAGGRDATLRYMGYIQEAAAASMRARLTALDDGCYAMRGTMDDGAVIAVEIRIDGDAAVVDFTGTSPPSEDNLNANLAIVKAAVIYCFRCLIDADIPLNEGVLEPLEIVVPTSLLRPPYDPDPERCPAVVGGNVETSQRITDVLLGALGLAAASQGTMNNLTFGDGGFGYYETICGGAGAGPDFDGADAVHTHMTNTRLTDPEVLEAQFPVRVRRFEIRRGSGGDGRHRGGDGCRRELEFLAPLEVSILSQRRTTRPFGLAGGEAGAAGRNTLLPAAGGERELPGVVHLRVHAGDRLRIETPGGGGYGRPTRRETP